MTATSWLILAPLLLFGFIYVDHMTHNSLHRKAMVHHHENEKIHHDGQGGNIDSGNEGKSNSDGLTFQEAAMHALKTTAYEDPTLVAGDGVRYHLIFSTDCSEFQHWQSYLMFHSAFKVDQPGTITRIASGCSNEEAVKARQWHQEHISSVMGEQFLLHLTPHFSGVKDADGNTIGDYKFFNKPFGLLHWLEHGIGFDDSDSHGEDGNGRRKLNNDGDVVILIDPDMVLLRPITGDFSNDRDVVIGKRHNKDRRMKVEHGSPFAQKYGFGTQWRTFNLHEIAGEDSPSKKVSQGDGGTFYPAGPPYLGTVRDMHAIAEKWSEFVPRVHKEYPYLLAEMFAYCIAAAHLELPHQIIDSLMVSNTSGGGEGWPMVDALPRENHCEIARKHKHEDYPVPSVIHYCQRYAIKEWFFGKRKMEKDFFTCESPLMEEPPNNIVEVSDYKAPYGGGRKELDERAVQREGFMVCGVLAALNDAGTFYKEHHCNGNGNMAKTLNLNPQK